MFFKSFKKEDEKPRDGEVESALMTTIESLENDISALKHTIAKLKCNDDCEFVFDWESAGAFSIERSRDGVTTIGYTRNVDSKTSPGEWALYCNITTHNKLAESFREWLRVKGTAE
jgi:hypothetical protein